MHRTPHLPALAAALLLSYAAVPASAQSLHGSRRSVAHSYRYATRHDLTFARDVADIRRSVRTGELVRLDPVGDYVLHRVSYPYVTPTTRIFVRRLANEYHGVCGAPMVITSATRPESRQPANSSPRSVHPAGIAVDLRRPTGACLTWLRRTLLTLEDSGVVDATEEHRPAHFHVIVFGEPYRRFLASR